jgi:hypothetical protein
LVERDVNANENKCSPTECLRIRRSRLSHSGSHAVQAASRSSSVGSPRAARCPHTRRRTVALDAGGLRPRSLAVAERLNARIHA